MDAFAVESHKKAAAAQDAGYLAASIIPLDGIDPEGNPIVFDQDQGIRRGTGNLYTGVFGHDYAQGGNAGRF